MGVLRADYIYSYPTSAGNPPNSQECRICVLQWTWKTVFGAAGFFIFLAIVAAIAICWRLAVIARERRRAAVGAVGLLLATSSIVQFWVVMLTEGASDLIKQMVLASFMTRTVVRGRGLFLLPAQDWKTRARTAGNDGRPDVAVPSNAGVPQCRAAQGIR